MKTNETKELTIEAIQDDIKRLADANKFDEIKNKYGQMFKDAVMECSKKYGWWFPEKLEKADVVVGKFIINIAHWSIDTRTMTCRSVLTFPYEWQSIEGKFIIENGKLTTTKPEQTTALFERED